jgi:hydroxymethylbilane synthase
VSAALRLGTRGSPLALWQANTVAGRLQAAGSRVEIVRIKTSGDRLQEAPLSEVGGKRLFVKEIEDALLREEIDLAVHSAKDMSAVLPDGLAIAAVLPREDPRDALVLPAAARARDLDAALAALGDAPAVGTSSVRRAAQLSAVLPRATFTPVRGNVDTRLRKLDSGGFDAIVLACAGMRRLGFERRISAAIPVERCIPAPGQGIVAVEIRARDARTRAAVEKMNDRPAAIALDAERAVVTALGGGCQLPLGAIALVADGALTMRGIVTSLDGSRAIRAETSGSPGEAAAVGARLAAELTRGGAGEILDEVRRARGPVEGSY